MSVKLGWEGKGAQVPRKYLPLQVVETVNSTRADRGSLLELMDTADEDGWRNKLIWGDNLHALTSLAEELAGKVDLVYIDPPFDSRQDYKVRISVGEGADSAEQELVKLSSIIEEKAYRDTWGQGVDSYLHMLYQRLTVLRELLSEQGSIFLHLAPNVSHLARVILDEIFGPENFRAEIIWQRVTAHSDTNDFGTIHDSILCFSKSSKHIWNPQYRPYDRSYIDSHYTNDDGDGRRYLLDNLTSPNPRPNMTYVWKGHQPPAYGWRYSVETMTKLDAEGRIWYPNSKSKRPRLKRYLDDMPGVPLGDVWADIHPVNSQAQERIGYDTQKPEKLLERIIKSSSNEGSIVLDCFAGSGTTPVVAERLKRRWVAVDIGRFAVHTARKRLLDVSSCKPFVVANLGQYERQVWQQETTGPEVQAYLDFIIDLYGGTAKHGYRHVHGEIDRRAVHVGSVDAPVTLAEVKETAEEAAGNGYTMLDVLGWEWELGLHELVEEVAKDSGIGVQLKRIPREIMDKRAVAAGEIVFHELAALEVRHTVKKRALTVSLEDFILPHPELVPVSVRAKVTSWSDYIDYWAVDFTFGSDGAGDTFHNQWQAFRTQGDRSLALSAGYEYDDPGSYTVLVKVVDIFGNDTTTALKVDVK